MNLLSEIRERRREILASASQNGVTSVNVVGSASKGTATPQSDIDFLVTMEPGRSYLDLIGFLLDMEDLFGRQVDVFTEGSLHLLIRDEVLASAVPL